MSKLKPMVSPALERTIHKYLAKSPEQRWQTVSDLKSELQWVVTQGNESPTIAVPVQRRTRWTRLGVAAGALVLLLSAAAVALHYWREQPKAATEIRFDIPLPPKANLRLWTFRWCRPIESELSSALQSVISRASSGCGSLNPILCRNCRTQTELHCPSGHLTAKSLVLSSLKASKCPREWRPRSNSL